MMPFASMGRNGLHLSQDEIWEIFTSFIARQVSANDPEWLADLHECKRGILRRHIKRVLLPWSSRVRRNPKGRGHFSAILR